METSPFLRWCSFTFAFVGSFYVLMTGSLVTHEILGHGLAAVVDGSPGMVFQISPGFSGYAGGTRPPSPTGDVFIRSAGIAVNLLIGLAGFFLYRRGGVRLTPTRMALFWVATTELGHAVGYTLQGLLFFQGDAGGLPVLLGRTWRAMLATVMIGLFLLFACSSMSAVARFVRDHFQPASLPAYRVAFLAGFTLPMAAVVIVAPGLPERDLVSILAFDGGVVAVLVAVSLGMVRRLPRDTEPKGRPVAGWISAAWASGAVATFALTSLWLSRGVTVAIFR